MALRVRVPLLGEAGGGGDATANGASLSLTWSIAPGAATAASTAGGASLSLTWSLAAGAASAASTAAGAALSNTWSLAAGTASAASAASGASLGLAWSLAPGAATASSEAAGAALSLAWSMAPGAASAASTASGAALGLTWSLAPGSASATGDASAPGADLGLAWSLSAGSATAASTAAGASLSLTWTLAPGAATGSGGSNATAAGVALSFGWDLVPGGALVPNNFHAAGPVRMPRALNDILRAVAAPFDMVVERERRTAITPEELPRVLLYALDTQIEAEFAGATALRTQRIHVEVVDAVRDGDDTDHVQDRVSAMMERIRVALDANPTLGGASLGVTVEEGTGSRANELVAQEYESRVLIVSAAYVS